MATGGDPVAKLKLIEKLKIAIEKSIRSGKLKDDVVAKLQEVTSPGNLGRTAAFIAAYAAAHVSPLAPGLAVLDAYFIGSSAGELGLALYQLYLDLESATTEGELTSASDSLSSMLSGPIADSLLKLLTLGAAKGAAVFRKNYDVKISIDPNKLGSNLGNVEIKITRKGVPGHAQPGDGRSLKAKAGDLEEEARKKREYDPKPLAPSNSGAAAKPATVPLTVDPRSQRLAVQEAVEEGSLSVVSPRSAVVKAASDAEHHIFTKSRRAWFKERYKIDVDDFVVDVDAVTHDALHTGKAPLKNKAGWWDSELMTRIETT